MLLSPKEQELLQILEKAEKKLNITEISKQLNSSLPYTSQLVAILEARSQVQIEQQDKRSKYVTLVPESERIAGDPKNLILALKLISFFTAHAQALPANLTQKLLESLSDEEQGLINSHREQIIELEKTW